MMNYEKEPHIITMILLYFALFLVFLIDAFKLFIILLSVNFVYSLLNINISDNFNDIIKIDILSATILSFLLLFKKREMLKEVSGEFIKEMNKLF